MAVAVFLVALCPDTLCMRHQDRQMTALPVCPPENGTIILFPKPENCSEFYQCADGVAFTHHCPPDLYYCEEKETCTWIWDPECTFNCTMTKINPVPAAAKFVPDCPPPTFPNITFVPNPDNCSTYFKCDNGIAVEMECPVGLYFCNQLDLCTWVWDPECTFDCTMKKIKPVPAADKFAAECPPPPNHNITIIPNPNNCSSFFECDNGIAVEVGCPDGLYFCSEKGLCTWNWDPDCKFDCTITNTQPVFVEQKFDAIFERDDRKTIIDKQHQ